MYKFSTIPIKTAIGSFCRTKLIQKLIWQVEDFKRHNSKEGGQGDIHYLTSYRILIKTGLLAKRDT